MCSCGGGSFPGADKIRQRVCCVLVPRELADREPGLRHQGVQFRRLAGAQEIVVGFKHNGPERRGGEVGAETTQHLGLRPLGVDEQDGGRGGEAARDDVGGGQCGDHEFVLVVGRVVPGMQGGHAGIARRVGEKRQRPDSVGEGVRVKVNFDVVEVAMLDETCAHGGRRLEGHHGGGGVEVFRRDRVQAEIGAHHPEDGARLAETRPQGLEHFRFIEALHYYMVVHAVPGREEKLAAVAACHSELAPAGDRLEQGVEPHKAAPTLAAELDDELVAPGGRLARSRNDRVMHQGGRVGPARREISCTKRALAAAGGGGAGGSGGGASTSARNSPTES